MSRTKAIVFDYDDVIFKDIKHMVFEELESGNYGQGINYTIQEHGYIPEYLYELEACKDLIKRRDERYHAQRMSSENIERLKDIITDKPAYILSYNNEVAIDEMLRLSGVRELFKSIFGRKVREHYGFSEKGRLYESFHKEYGMDTRYYSDSVSDFLEVLEYTEIESRILVTKADSYDPGDLKIVHKDNITKPFY
jgi:hypothetical protein